MPRGRRRRAARPGRQRLPRPGAATRGHRGRGGRGRTHWGAGAGASRLVTGTLALHTELERGARPRSWAAGRAGVLDRLPRQPARGHRAGRPRHPGRLRRPRPRLAGRRRRLSARRGRGDAAQRRRRGRGGARRRPETGGRWCWPSRSTPCSATRRRSPSWPRSARAHDAVLVVDEAHGLGVAGAAARPGRASSAWPGCPHVIVTATLSKSLGSPGRRGARPARGRRAPGQPGPAVHLRHRPGPGCGRRPPSPRSGRSRPTPSWPAGPRAGRDPGAAPAGVEPPGRRGAVGADARARSEALAAAEACAAHGVRVGCFRPPSVPDGVSRLRLTASARLTRRGLAARRARSWPRSRGSHR